MCTDYELLDYMFWNEEKKYMNGILYFYLNIAFYWANWW